MSVLCGINYQQLVRSYLGQRSSLQQRPCQTPPVVSLNVTHLASDGSGGSSSVTLLPVQAEPREDDNRDVPAFLARPPLPQTYYNEERPPTAGNNAATSTDASTNTANTTTTPTATQQQRTDAATTANQSTATGSHVTTTTGQGRTASVRYTRNPPPTAPNTNQHVAVSLQVQP